MKIEPNELFLALVGALASNPNVLNLSEEERELLKDRELELQLLTKVSPIINVAWNLAQTVEKKQHDTISKK